MPRVHHDEHRSLMRNTATSLAFGSMFFLGVGSAVIGAAARNIGLAAHEIGLLQTSQNVGFIVSVIAFGSLADTHAKPRLMAAGSVVLALAFGTFFRLPGLWLNVAIMTAVGVGIGSYEGVSDALLLDLHPKRAGFMITVNHLFVTLGALVITTYLVFLQIDWRRSMVQAATVVAVIAVACAVIRVPARPAQHLRLSERFAVLRREKPVMVIFWATAIALGFQLTLTGTLTTFLMEFRAFDQVTSKLGLIVLNLGVALGRVIIGYSTPNRGLYRGTVLLFGAAAVISTTVLSVDLGPGNYVLLFLCGLSISSVLPLLITMAGLAYPGFPGTAMAVVKIGVPVGGIVMPLLFAGLSRGVGVLPAFYLFPAMMTVGTLLLVAASPIMPREYQAPVGVENRT